MKFEGDLPKSEATASKPKRFSNGHWKFPEQMGALQYVGFIYVIRDTYLGRFYLGKKSFRSTSVANRGAGRAATLG